MFGAGREHRWGAAGRWGHPGSLARTTALGRDAPEAAKFRERSVGRHSYRCLQPAMEDLSVAVAFFQSSCSSVCWRFQGICRAAARPLHSGQQLGSQQACGTRRADKLFSSRIPSKTQQWRPTSLLLVMQGVCCFCPHHSSSVCGAGFFSFWQ